MREVQNGANGICMFITRHSTITKIGVNSLFPKDKLYGLRNSHADRNDMRRVSQRNIISLVLICVVILFFIYPAYSDNLKDIVELIKSNDRFDQQKAIKELSAMGNVAKDPVVLEELLHLTKNVDDKRADIATQAICMIGDKDAIFSLLKRYGQVLAELNRFSMMPVEKIQNLSIDEQKSFEAAKLAPSVIGDGLDVGLQLNHSIFPIIKEALNDSDWQVRIGAISILSDMARIFKSKELIPLYISKLDDPVPGVKEQALGPLKALSDAEYKTGKDFKGDKGLWQQWWHEHQNEY